MLLLVVAPPQEAALIRETLEPLRIGSDARFVPTVKAGLDALHEQVWDAIILAIPMGETAIALPVETYVDIAHGSPVIAVVDTIGEDAAAELVRRGAADVVSYGRIARLPAVFERELHTKSRIVSHQQTSRTAYQWFASIVNNIPVGIVFHNERGEIVLCNETALNLLGLTEDELLGATSLDPRWNVIREDGAPFAGSEHPSSEATRTKKPVHGVLMGVFRPRTNDRVWLRVNAIPVFDNDERLAYVVAQFSDVTENHTMSEKLRASEERFRTAFEHSGAGMVISSLASRVLQANETACRLFGRPKEDIIGRSMEELTHPDDIAASWKKGVEESDRASRTIVLEKRYLQPSGRIVWGAVTVEVIPDAHGNPLHYVVVIQDITARKDAEAERNRLQAQLLQAQKMEALGILAGGVAHDFNNILAAILCSADVLLHDLRRLPDSGELPEIVFELQTAAQRGTDLVRQILTFSRHAKKRRVTLDPAEALEESIGLLKKICPANVDLRLSIQSHPFVLADATQLQQVLMNLGTNSFHALENTKGVVSFELNGVVIDAATARTEVGLREGSYAHIRVTDNGSGMDAHTIEHLFEPFFTTKHAGKGTGLGMSVVHGIVTTHEGSIRVQSTIGQGTTVDLWFPAVSGVVNIDEGKKSGILQGKAEHVLVIDDEVGLARIFGRVLQSIGYRVTVETDSAKALEIIQKDASSFDVALIDLHMPPPGGIDVAQRLHELRPHVPIFIMSGFSDALGGTPPPNLGIVGILQKPVTRETLATELRRVLDSLASI